MSIGLMCAPAWAQSVPAVLATGDLPRHAVRVEQSAEGVLSLLVAPDTRAVLGPGGGAPSVRFESSTVGGAQVLVVRVAAPPEAYGAVVVEGAAGEASVAWSGSLALRGDDPGEQVASEIVVRDLDGDGAPDVVVAQRRQDVRLCQVGSPLVDARALAPASLRFVPVSLNPLRADLLTSALPSFRSVAATVLHNESVAARAHVRVVARALGGVSAGPSDTLTDGDPRTSTVLRPHDFAVTTVTLAGVPADAIVLTAPRAPASLPSRLFVLGGEGVALDVSVPSTPPGGQVAIPLDPPSVLRCLSLVVVEGAARGDTGIADVAVRSRLDRDPDLARTLVRELDTPHAEEAAMLLADLGEPGATSLGEAIPTLSGPAGRAAVRLLATLRTASGARALVVALRRSDLATDARGALQRLGVPALDALSAIVATDPRAADVLATLHAPLPDRLRAFLPALGAEASVWHTVRNALRALLREAATGTAGVFEAWVTSASHQEGEPATRALSVAAEASETDGQRELIAERALAVGGETFGDRYRLLLPLVGDAAGRALVGSVALHDENADLRAEAVHALARVHDEQALRLALADVTPRVRAAAAEGLRGALAARSDLLRVLRTDSWPSVRAASARALDGDGAAVEALLGALDDPASSVVDAAIQALAGAPGPTVAGRLMAFAEDGHRSPTLRGEALEALARRCEHPMVERLVALVSRQVDPMLPPPEQEVGHQALAALAHVDPSRARALVARMEANRAALEAVQRATQGACEGVQGR